MSRNISVNFVLREGMAALLSNEDFLDEAENLREDGVWQQLVLFDTGKVNQEGCRLAPETCR